MHHDTSPQLEGCTIQRKDGRFCDNPSADAMPFPICGYHASKLFIHMREMVREFSDDPLRRMMAAVGDVEVQRARAKRVQPKDWVVYYVLIGDILKIGATSNLAQRMQHYPPYRKLLATEPDTGGTEARRLAEFADLLASGNEWFRFEGALVEHVRKIREQSAAA